VARPGRPLLIRELGEDELSPYLLQHREQLVDWYPFSPEVFALAAELDRPVFLSIGYAACHWCHVMAHESFEDPEVAAQLNADFVSVKVDREERPDVDAIYMAATQAQTGSGGWPMSVFCTPEAKPFYAGTYFPPEDRGQTPSFRHVLDALTRVWTHDRAEVSSHAEQLTEAVAREMAMAERLAKREDSEGLPDFAEVLAKAASKTVAKSDRRLGGFSGAPKFPRPSLTDLCLLAWLESGDEEARDCAQLSLDAMLYGGLYDHIDGGFARYSVDAQWLVPHFEKMLTDQALLALGYLHAFQVLGKDDYAQAVSETLDAVEAKFLLSSGAYATAIDADAAGEEGLHIALDAEQAKAALAPLGPEISAQALAHFGLDAGPNFEGRIIPTVLAKSGIARSAALEQARLTLSELRAAGPQAFRDEKVVLECNAMLALALLEAGSALRQDRFSLRAEALLEYLVARHLDQNKLHRIVWQSGRVVSAMAGDAAWLLLALSRYQELSGDGRFLSAAKQVAKICAEEFVDAESGVVSTAQRSSTELLLRPTEIFDGATPSATAVVASALLRHGALHGDEGTINLGTKVLSAVAPLLVEHPDAVPDLVAALALASRRSELRIVGVAALADLVDALWLPATLRIPSDGAALTGVNPGQEAVYLCHGYHCLAPITETDGLRVALRSVVGGSALKLGAGDA